MLCGGSISKVCMDGLLQCVGNMLNVSREVFLSCVEMCLYVVKE